MIVRRYISVFITLLCLKLISSRKKKESSKKDNFSFDRLLSGLDKHEQQIFKEELVKEVKKFHAPTHSKSKQTTVKAAAKKRKAKPKHKVLPGVCNPICAHQCIHGCDFRCCIPGYQQEKKIPSPPKTVALPGACSPLCSPICFPSCTEQCCSAGQGAMFHQPSLAIKNSCPNGCSQSCYPSCNSRCCISQSAINYQGLYGNYKQQPSFKAPSIQPPIYAPQLVPPRPSLMQPPRIEIMHPPIYAYSPSILQGQTSGNYVPLSFQIRYHPVSNLPHDTVGLPPGNPPSPHQPPVFPPPPQLPVFAPPTQMLAPPTQLLAPPSPPAPPVFNPPASPIISPQIPAIFHPPPPPPSIFHPPPAQLNTQPLSVVHQLPVDSSSSEGLQLPPIYQCGETCPVSCAPKCLPNCCNTNVNSIAKQRIQSNQKLKKLTDLPQFSKEPLTSQISFGVPRSPTAPSKRCSPTCPVECAPECSGACCDTSTSFFPSADEKTSSEGGAPSKPYHSTTVSVTDTYKPQTKGPVVCPNGCHDSCLPDCTESCCNVKPTSGYVKPELEEEKESNNNENKKSKIASQLAMLRRKRSLNSMRYFKLLAKKFPLKALSLYFDEYYS